MKRIFYLLFLSTVVVFVSSCMEKEDKPPYFAHVESVSITLENSEEALTKLDVRNTKSIRLAASILPLEAGNKKTTWYSSDPEVATVSSAGLVEAHKLGETTIGVRTDDMRREAQIKVTVIPYIADVPMTKVNLNKAQHAFQITDANITLSVSYEPSNASEPVFTWVSSDSLIVKVSDKGVVTPIGHGNATVTAYAKDGSELSAVCKLTVNGLKDRNYDISGGINANDYYKIIYYPVNIEVTDDNGNTVVQTWLDRNLGAKQVATAYNDHLGYGSLFQWSRKADGHEQINATAPGVASFVNGMADANSRVADRLNAGHSKFIPTTAAPHDWCTQTSTQEHGFWGGRYIDNGAAAPLGDETQANNPCPEGYRVPTPNDFIYLVRKISGNSTFKYNTSLTVSNAANLFAESALHLPASGHVVFNTTTGVPAYDRGVYWTNMAAAHAAGVYNNSARFYILASGAIMINPYQRSNAYAIRCIRTAPLDKTELEF